MAAGEGFKNEFSQMNQDLAKTKYPANAYYEAINFRPATDKGLSDGALESIRGTLALTGIPNTSAVQKITLDVSVTGSLGFTITNNGVPISTAGTYTVGSSTSPEDIYNFLINDANFTAAFGTLYNIYFNSTSLLFYPLNLLTTTIVATGAAAASIIVDSNFIPAQTNLEVIGSTFINNDIYILTTNNHTKTPGQDSVPDSVGQIWKVDINNVDNTINSIELIYTNYLNFSTYNAIAPSAILGRYENTSIQRIYWTDFYNKLRSINVVNPQAFALDLSLIDVQASTDFDVPIMTNISSAVGTAVIPIGCYQLAYKLSNTGGASTIYSIPSNPIYVVTGGTLGAEEYQTGGAVWQEYHGNVRGTTTTKRITWTINNLDREFDRIEAVLLVREDYDEIPVIYSVFEGPIKSDTISIIVDGDVIASPSTLDVSLEDYLQLASVFTHCKTIETKDNRLIVGNVKNIIANLDYDSRAYRFGAPGILDLINVKGNSYATYNNFPVDYANIPEESDAISRYNLENSDPLHDSLSKYKSDGVTIGGEGPNISYEFVSIAVPADKTIEPVDPQPLPIVSTNPDYNNLSLNLGVYSADENSVDVLQEYPLEFPGAINNSMKYPQMNSIYWGYQNNEIYRVGIQFYDKSRNPYFVKWIGDIKFPDYFDTCPATNNLYEDGSQTGLTDYRKSFTDADVGVIPYGVNSSYVCQLGLKLDVKIPADLTDRIGGYSIVRVKREETDKAVVAEGIIPNMFYGSGSYFLPIDDMSYGHVNTNRSKLSFITPNILDSSLVIPSANMKLRCSSLLTSSNSTTNVNIQGGVASIKKNMLLKMFSQVPITAFERSISYGALMGVNASVAQGGDTHFNSAFFSEPANGNPSYLILLSSAMPAGGGGANKFFVHIYRFLPNQYGGDTFTSRANNEYILCSHFRPIKNKITDYTDSSFIYGGDVTNDIMDEERISVDWSAYVADPLNPDKHNSTTFFFPASSPVNRALRHGVHPNTNLVDTVNFNNDRTDYFYNTVYSTQNDIIKFFPKPDPFIANDEFINRFHISEIKINGELADSWAIFKPLNYWDVEGSYGGINGILMLQDQVFFIQDKAFGRLLVNPRTAITSTTGVEIQLGRGNVIDSHNYISVETGSKHQFSFLRSGSSLYFVDGRHKKIFQFSQGAALDPESDIKGMHSWLIKNLYGNLELTDRPVYNDPDIGINGIHGVYDYLNDELIYTFRRGINVGEEQSLTTPYTLVYNEKLKSFTAFYTHYPKNYITNNRSIVSANPSSLQDLYIHNYGSYGQFYGIYYDSSIQFFSNPKPEFTKTFNNLVIQTEVQNGTTLVDTDSGATPIHESFNYLEVSNDHQSNSVVLTPMSNLERFFRSWRTKIPRNSVAAAYTSNTIFARMTDKYLRIKLSFTNNNNKRFILHNIISFFKTHSPR